MTFCFYVNRNNAKNKAVKSSVQSSNAQVETRATIKVTTGRLYLNFESLVHSLLIFNF